MKRTVASALAVALVLSCATALAYSPPKIWDDLSWWGQSGATPAPVQDKVRSGYWWWPTEPASNVNDSELWGNRGVVYYHMYEVAPPPVPPVPPPPVPPPPEAERDIPVLNHILFDFDKAVLKPEGRAVADQAVQWLKDDPDNNDTVVIEGHTCDIGTAQYNMGLGQRRADAVKNYLIQSGIAQGRIQSVSLGESSPAVPNDGPANRKLNRRAMFKFSIVGD